MPIYIVKDLRDDDQDRATTLVEAPTAVRAVRMAAAGRYSVRPASAIEAARLAAGGTRLLVSTPEGEEPEDVTH